MSDVNKSNASGEDKRGLELSGDDALYLRWAQDIGFDLEVQKWLGKTEQVR